MAYILKGLISILSKFFCQSLWEALGFQGLSGLGLRVYQRALNPQPLNLGVLKGHGLLKLIICATVLHRDIYPDHGESHGKDHGKSNGSWDSIRSYKD